MCQLSETLNDATERNLMSVLLSVDQSAAFDNVSHEILINKLKLYNCGDQALEWFENYLSHRSQCVSMGSKLSSYKPLNSGLPQGFILGPLLYIIYTNELPNVMRFNKNCKHTSMDNKYLFGGNCPSCGTIICYADDATLVITSNSR